MSCSVSSSEITKEILRMYVKGSWIFIYVVKLSLKNKKAACISDGTNVPLLSSYVALKKIAHGDKTCYYITKIDM